MSFNKSSVRHILTGITANMYSVRLMPPKKPELTPLQLAATKGDMLLVQELLQSNGALNIYATNAKDEALLADVIRAGQPNVAQLLLDVYEADLNTVTQFFRQQSPIDGASQFWLTAKILVACGNELCDAVESLVTETMRLPHVAGEPGTRRGLVVLLKRDQTRIADHHRVLWLSPNASNKAEEQRTVARIIETVYVENNSGGLLDVLQHRQSLLALAARQGLTDVFFRLHRLFGAADWLTATDCMTLLCNLAKFATIDAVTALRALAERLDRFQLDDDSLYQGSDAWRLLETPLRLQQTTVFEYLLGEIARVQLVTPGAVLNRLIQNSIYTCLHAQWANDEANLVPFVDAWMRHSDVDLLSPHTLQPTWPFLLMLCQLDGLSDELLIAILVRCSEHLHSDSARQQRRDVFSRMVTTGRIAVLRGWFDECPQLPEVIYSQSYAVYNLMLESIGPNEKRMAMAEFLLDIFAEKLNERSVTNFVLRCSEWTAANGMLCKLLALPQCANVADGWELWGDARSPLFTALICRSVPNFDVLYESVREKAVICAMKEYNDDCILAAAIWSPETIRNLFLYEGYMVEDDADDIDGPVADELPTGHTAKSDTDLSIERAAFDRIFDQLLDIGCDPLSINASGQTLLHFAVFNDNLPMLERLIRLSVDPMRADKYGYLPLHAVRSIPVFQALLQACESASGRTAPELMSERSANGKTPLTAVFQSGSRHESKIALLDAMLAAGGNCTDVCNNGNKSTLLHSPLTSVPLTRWLLANGADVNARNGNGDTPLNEQLIYNNIDVIELLLAAPALDWSLIVNNGAKLLGWLVSLSADDFERIRPLLVPTHEADMAELVRRNMNANDEHEIPILHSAIRSDTNAYCLRLLLQHRDAGLSRAGIVMASIGDPEAQRLAIELCDTAADREANFTPAVLTHALGHPSFADIPPCVSAVRAMLAAGVPVTGVSEQNETYVHRVLQCLRGGQRKAVLTIVAALVAAGSMLPERSLRGTVLQCLLEQ